MTYPFYELLDSVYEHFVKDFSIYVLKRHWSKFSLSVTPLPGLGITIIMLPSVNRLEILLSLFTIRIL